MTIKFLLKIVLNNKWKSPGCLLDLTFSEKQLFQSSFICPCLTRLKSIWFLIPGFISVNTDPDSFIEPDVSSFFSWLSLLVFSRILSYICIRNSLESPQYNDTLRMCSLGFNKLAKQQTGLDLSKDSANQRGHWNIEPFIKALVEALNYVKLFPLTTFNYSWRNRISKSK